MGWFCPCNKLYQLIILSEIFSIAKLFDCTSRFSVLTILNNFTYLFLWQYFLLEICFRFYQYDKFYLNCILWFHTNHPRIGVIHFIHNFIQICTQIFDGFSISWSFCTFIRSNISCPLFIKSFKKCSVEKLIFFSGPIDFYIMLFRLFCHFWFNFSSIVTLKGLGLSGY